MNRLREPEELEDQALDADREISLGTPTILGIFFALALVCAGFFGFGYTMGRKSAQTASASSISSDGLGVSATSAPKPAAGSGSAQSVVTPLPAATTPPQATEIATVPLTSSNANSGVTPADRMIVGDKPPAAAPQPATTNLQPATSFVVQVTAVSSQDLADLEVNALTKKGYKVEIRHEPQDKLLHVQIGPFADKKEAQAMQARVLADGFNAIVK